MTKQTFRRWDVSQSELFPPTYRELVPAGHLVHFVRKIVVEDLDLSAIYATYTSPTGQPPYDPRLMTALLLYSYCRGIYSSRRIELACEERLDYRALAGNEHPDHSTISLFRKTHIEALMGLFTQVLALCRDAGLAKLGHVALDGTKVRANASKHSAMSYKRMVEAEPELAKEVAEWLEKSRAADESEDAEHGESQRGDEMDEEAKAKARELAKTQRIAKTKQRRLENVRAGKKQLEDDAQARAEQVAAERAAKEEAQGRKISGPKPKVLDGVPEDKAQVNFTDSESRIMKTKDGFEQAYTAHAAVDAESQVIVSQDVTARQNDGPHLKSMVDQIKQNLGATPQQLSADAGYSSEENLLALDKRDIDAYVATGRQKHGSASATGDEETNLGPLARAMREKLRAGGWESPYRVRKHTVEPVFGQIKGARGFRQFLTRGLENVRAEWSLLCTAHNLLKLAGLTAARPLPRAL